MTVLWEEDKDHPYGLPGNPPSRCNWGLTSEGPIVHGLSARLPKEASDLFGANFPCGGSHPDYNGGKRCETRLFVDNEGVIAGKCSRFKYDFPYAGDINLDRGD